MLTKLLKYYSFIIITLMVTSGFFAAQSTVELGVSLLLVPLLLYFWMSVVPKRTKAIELNVVTPKTKKKSKARKAKVEKQIDVSEPEELAIEGEEIPNKVDIDRRAFIKLIGSAGMSVFLLSIFTKRAQGAFFGSVPGPGTVAIKDSSGAQIDPAEKQPTDGYRVVQLDDSTPAYYGFQNKDGAWFIMQEDASGNYRYTSGSSDFTNATTGWPNRAALSYNYFENVF